MKTLFLFIRFSLTQAPLIIFYTIFRPFFSAKTLRAKAALTPYSSIRKLLLKKSGIPMGEDSEIGFGSLVLGISKNPPAVVIGDRAAIGPYVTFISSSYPDNSLLNNHPQLKKNLIKISSIIIENDVWIGAYAIIFPGVKIGKGAVVGAGSIVNKDVEPFSIVAGNPAQLIREIDPF